MESYNKEHADNPIDIQYIDADASAALIDLYNGRYDDIMNLFKPSAIWEGIVRIVPNIPQTLEIAAVAAVIGIVLGFLLALFRIKNFRCSVSSLRCTSRLCAARRCSCSCFCRTTA